MGKTKVHGFNLQESPNSKQSNKKDLKVKSFLELSPTRKNRLFRFTSSELPINTIKFQQPLTSQHHIKDIYIEFPRLFKRSIRILHFSLRCEGLKATLCDEMFSWRLPRYTLPCRRQHCVQHRGFPDWGSSHCWGIMRCSLEVSSGNKQDTWGLTSLLFFHFSKIQDYGLQCLFTYASSGDNILCTWSYTYLTVDSPLLLYEKSCDINYISLHSIFCSLVYPFLCVMLSIVPVPLNTRISSPNLINVRWLQETSAISEPATGHLVFVSSAPKLAVCRRSSSFLFCFHPRASNKGNTSTPKKETFEVTGH